MKFLFYNSNIKDGFVYDGCHCGRGHITVLPNGDVYACRRMESKVGNIFEEKQHLFDIWNSKELDEYSSLAITPYVKVGIKQENNVASEENSEAENIDNNVSDYVNVNLYYIKDLSLGLDGENIEEIVTKVQKIAPITSIIYGTSYFPERCKTNAVISAKGSYCKIRLITFTLEIACFL